MSNHESMYIKRPAARPSTYRRGKRKPIHFPFLPSFVACLILVVGVGLVKNGFLVDGASAVAASFAFIMGYWTARRMDQETP